MLWGKQPSQECENIFAVWDVCVLMWQHQFGQSCSFPLQMQLALHKHCLCCLNVMSLKVFYSSVNFCSISQRNIQDRYPLSFCYCWAVSVNVSPWALGSCDGYFFFFTIVWRFIDIRLIDVSGKQSNQSKRKIIVAALLNLWCKPQVKISNASDVEFAGYNALFG